MSGPEKIETILYNSPSIRMLTEIARANSKLESILEQEAPNDLKGRIRVSSLSAGKLTLLANGPVVATKTRFIIPELLRRLQEKASSFRIDSID